MYHFTITYVSSLSNSYKFFPISWQSLKYHSRIQLSNFRTFYSHSEVRYLKAVPFLYITISSMNDCSRLNSVLGNMTCLVWAMHVTWFASHGLWVSTLQPSKLAYSKSHQVLITNSLGGGFGSLTSIKTAILKITWDRYLSVQFNVYMSISSTELNESCI